MRLRYSLDASRPLSPEQAVSRRGDSSPGPPRPPQLHAFRRTRAAWDAGWGYPGNIRLTQLRCRHRRARSVPVETIHMIVLRAERWRTVWQRVPGQDSKARCCLSTRMSRKPVNKAIVVAHLSRLPTISAFQTPLDCLARLQAALQATSTRLLQSNTAPIRSARWRNPLLAASKCRSRVSQPNN